MRYLLAMFMLGCLAGTVSAEEIRYEESLVFPLDKQHNHAPGLVECPDGSLLVSWYRGSGEREADDVLVLASRRPAGSDEWSEPFLMVDTPGFPDGNTVLWIDGQERLWLFWPLIIANTWESCLTEYRYSSDYQGEGAPKWDWQGIIPLKPVNFKEKMLTTLDEELDKLDEVPAEVERLAGVVRDKVGSKIDDRMGWQTRCKPTVLKSGRILLPLYTDTYSVSLMAISDDGGETWFASEPLVGYGNIQPAVLQRDDGTVVAYMRENGPRNRIRYCESPDDGMSWGPVTESELPNPGAGIDAVELANGHWAIIYNDTEKGRNSLAVSISDDEGKTWKWTRHLEQQPRGSFHYPVIIQGKDDTIHVAYSYFVPEGKTMKHAAFTEAWVQAGDQE